MLHPPRAFGSSPRGAQVLERERGGELSGTVLWGLGKVVALEEARLRPRMIDLDPDGPHPASGLVAELVDSLLHPDGEDHIAYRAGRRLTARLVRPDAVPGRLTLPEGADWVLEPDGDGVFDRPQVKQLPARSLAPRDVRVAVEAAGLNFWDVFRSLGFIEEGDLGREMCGHVVGIGSDVSTVEIGDRVVGLGFGAFAHEMVTHEELVAPATEGVPASALATIPSAFVSAALSFRFSGLEAGERVLVHAGAGGVGTAAIQLARAAGAEVFATASAPKHAFVRSLGVEHVFDSRQTGFGGRILEATAGKGVHVVLNSLTSEGFIEASLSCLATGGRFVELARRDILSREEMAAVRPDAAYEILELDVLKKTDPAQVGEVLRDVMGQLAAGAVEPLVHSRWPLAEAGPALDFMRSARHLGKIVVTANPLSRGRLRQDRTYLVTGGLGGIGCAVAGWLARHGAGTVVLNGRREPGAEAEEAIEALRGRGHRIEVEQADVTDPAEVDAMLERIDAKLPPLGGVIHSVGVLSDAALTNQTWSSFDRVLRPKIAGAWHLHRATADRDLDLFVLFSSRVGVMGNPGQANHAAANAFLDQLAGHRRAQGLPGQAIAWGAWSEIGEAAEQRERIEQRRAALGGRWFTPQQGIRALDRLVRKDAAASVVMSMDWQVFEEAVEDRPPLLEHLLSSASDSGTDDVTAPSDDLLTRLRSAPAAEHEKILASFLQQEVQAVLRLPKTPSPTIGFFDLGMDSLMTVELRNRLNRSFDGEYTASNTIVFDHPDIKSLALHLTEELGPLATADGAHPENSSPSGALGSRLIGAMPPTSRPPQTQTPAAKSPAPEASVAESPAAESPAPEASADSLGSRPAAAAESPAAKASAPESRLPVGNHDHDDGNHDHDDGIAVVGMACRFPGAADLTAFWELLETGADAIADGRRGTDPADGRRGTDPADGRRGTGPWSGVVGDPDADDLAYRRGAFVDGIDRFDSGFFGIRPIEARLMDPQQRMLLETSWQALEDAGFAPDDLRGSRTGVYAGIGSSEYRDLIAACNRADGYIGTTGSAAVGRIAFVLGLEGPAMPIDLACASSLAAVHQAVASLQRGEVDLALAGGVNAVLSPGVSRFMMDVGMLSPTGHCSPFDASADGYVRGEGCGMAVLKRLSEAKADGDRIWAVIRGSAVNQNGASAGLTVPNGSAQERVMREALARTGLPPSHVDYLEAHATGSLLGDSIELNAAAAVYGEGRERGRPLLVGSAKSSIGHLEWAAGIAALIKTILSMNKRLIPGHPHLEEPNPQVEWNRLPLQVNSGNTAWPTDSGRPPLAGVNAFGLAGANASIIVEGCEPPSTGAPTDGISAGGPRLVPASLSGMLQDSLASYEASTSEESSTGRPDRLLALEESATGRPDRLLALEESATGRPDRLLALSGKTEDTLQESAKRYLSWLDGREGTVSDVMLSDMAWTAAVGRNHFPCRAGLVFSSADQLRQALSALADAEMADADEMGNPVALTTQASQLRDGDTGCADGFNSTGVVRSTSDGDTGCADGLADGFVRAVADAYEAGMDIPLAGLFAGETRCRISIPGYPFQRRRHWVEPLNPE